jgi:CheY-like chemotaxis protein
VTNQTRQKTFHRILIVDDDQTTRELAVKQNLSYRIVSVNDGRAALRLLRRDADFSAAIFSMTMPHLPGVDVVRYMKTEKRLMSIPVIIVSGAGGLTAVADSFAAGAIVFLGKPFVAEQLHHALEIAIGAQKQRDTSRTT